MVFKKVSSFACLFILTIGTANTAWAQLEINSAPINYESREPTDRVRELAKLLEEGKVELQWDEEHGYLPAILETLKVSPKTQTLVFSKTSRQAPRIKPATPRALYFSDDVYVGWVQNGAFVELAAVDPEQGAMFYSLDQIKTDTPRIKRDSGQCLTCHATSNTEGVPGFLVRSVIPKSSGHPEYRLGTLKTDHRTPFEKRFGGWYVTGTHGAMRHRGNVTFRGVMDDPLDEEAGANLMELPKKVHAERYLEPSSDIVALMVLEHQSQMHNWITKASYTCRQATYYEEEMNRLFDRESDERVESTERRIKKASDDLVRYLLFSNECKLTAPVEGSAEFKEHFMSVGPRDSKGRSLRDLDLQTRLLKYPCSYLIYAESFRSLPAPILVEVKALMLEILQSDDLEDGFPHLTKEDRANILAILKETHPLFQ